MLALKKLRLKWTPLQAQSNIVSAAPSGVNLKQLSQQLAARNKQLAEASQAA